MTNPIKSQIAANRERFDEKFSDENINEQRNDVGEVFIDSRLGHDVKSFLNTSQTSLLQTAIAAVEGMTDTQKSGWGQSTNYSAGFNAALSKVVELLKGGIEII